MTFFKPLLIVLALLFGFNSPLKALAADQPNIIFIFSDDWGYGDLSCHGSNFCQTPNLDQMAKEGIDFSNFTVNSPVCSPSRVAVMTGQFPARQSIHQHFAGVKSNRKRSMPDWLDPEGPSLPRMMQSKRVTRRAISESGILAAALAFQPKIKYGYDDFATFNGSKTNEIKKDGLASVDHAETFIRKNSDGPFFVNLWLHEVHLAHFPLEHYMEKFKDLDEQQQVYASVIAEGDEGVGRILKLLKELNIDDNTLVVFSSDNGPESTRGLEDKIHHAGQPGLGGYYSVGETAGLKGEKRSLFAGGVRVPLIVRWPGVAPAGKIDKSSVLTAVDLLPTFVAIAGGELPEGYQPDGENVAAAFHGQPFQRTKPIFWEWRGGVDKPFTWPSKGVRDGRWKLLVNEDSGQTELYDLDQDWSEQKDVAESNPKVVETLKQDLDQWTASLPTTPDPRCCAKPKSKSKPTKSK